MEAAPMQPSQATGSSHDEPAAAVAAESNWTQVGVADCGVVGGSITETRAMTAAGSWSDLPGDLLSAVSAMVPTTLDRVRLAAVCRPWRATLASRRQKQAPPALPWLHFLPRVGTGHLLYSPEDGGAVMRVSLPSLAADSRLVGSHQGGWVAAFEEGRGLLAIVNLFSGAEVTLSEMQRTLVHVVGGVSFTFTSIRKLVFSEAPTSSGCILAAITAYWEVAILRIGCAKGGWEMAPCRDLERVLDIAFCNDKLYGLTVDPSHGTECLIRYQVRVRDEDPPVVKAARRMFVRRRDGARYMDDTTAYVSYILELHGKPAMAVLARWSPDHEPFFRVYELANMNPAYGIYEWAEVVSLGDYALFVGSNAPCKMIHISAGQHNGVEANHVYYVKDEPVDGDAVCMDANGCRAVYSGDGGFDDDGTKRRILSVGYYVVNPSATTWLLPPNL
jgi:hypothetical protein